MSKSHYARYREEREGVTVIEDDHGYASAIWNEDTVYIDEIYVVPKMRTQNVASGYADRIASIARERGINKMYGSVCTTAISATASLKVLLGYGFSLSHNEGDMIYMFKEI